MQTDTGIQFNLNVQICLRIGGHSAFNVPFVEASFFGLPNSAH